MNIHEYQAKALLAEHGVAVPGGDVAETAERAAQLAETLGATVVVKAQIHAGGRGKGIFQGKASGATLTHPDSERPLGGVVVVPVEQAGEIAHRMLGNVLVTKQTGTEGREVRHVLIAEGMGIEEEYYLAILLDRALKCPVFIVSREGGVDIEQVAAERPEAIVKVPVDPAVGYSPWIGRKIAFFLGVPQPLVSQTVKLVAALYRCFDETDASLAEINPLIRTDDGRILALDAKMSFDDNALWRKRRLGHPAPRIIWLSPRLRVANLK